MTQDSELIEKALEPVRQLLLQKSQASAQEQDKEYQYKKIDKEIITFRDSLEFSEKAKILLKKPKNILSKTT